MLTLEQARRAAANSLRRLIEQKEPRHEQIDIGKSLDLVVLGDAISRGAFTGYTTEEWAAIEALFLAVQAERKG